MNKKERIEMIRAMETIARNLDDKAEYEYWLTFGVAGVDISGDTTDEELEFCVKDENFADLMYNFLRTLGIKPDKAKGMLNCDGIISKENVPPRSIDSQII